MQIKDMFRKKIDREIQGVIIVGQGEETNVAQELEEYVVTRELQRHLRISLQHIKRYSGNHTENGCLDFRLLWKW